MRYALEVAYDGSSYSGWQKQPGRKTVQGEIEAVLGLLEGSGVRSVGAGRTDAGVHARGQVLSCELGKDWMPSRLLKAVNCNLPREIEIIRAARVDTAFNARHDALWREYVYFLWRGSSCFPHIKPFVWRVHGNWEASDVMDACKFLEGVHDFRQFTPQGECPRNSLRRVFKAKVVHGRNWSAFKIRASGFLFHMVRNIVGDLNRISEGKLSVEAFKARLSGGCTTCTHEMAPASGLFLWRIGYVPSPWE